MMLPSGQPLWQKGIPQSMQRAPCARSLSSGNLRSYSRQFCHVVVRAEMQPLEHHAVFSREHLDEFFHVLVPMIEHPARDRALGILMMPHDQRVQMTNLLAMR